MELSGISEGMLEGTVDLPQASADLDMRMDVDLQVHDLIVFRQTSLADMDSGNYDNGKYHLVDPIWLEICQQLTVVGDNRARIAQAEAKLTAEFAVTTQSH